MERETGCGKVAGISHAISVYYLFNTVALLRVPPFEKIKYINKKKTSTTSNPSMKHSLTLTKEDALIISRDMWLWLSQNPSKNKEQYLELHRPDLVDRMESDCSCCHYSFSKSKTGSCEDCPLLEFFESKVRVKSDITNKAPCLYGIYGKWANAHCVINYDASLLYTNPLDYELMDRDTAIRVSSACAKEIADAADAALADLTAHVSATDSAPACGSQKEPHQ